MKCKWKGVCKEIQKTEKVSLSCKPCQFVKFLYLVSNGKISLSEKSLSLIKSNSKIGEVKDINFSCPFLRTRMLSKCSVESCQFYTPKSNHCIIAHAKNKQNTNILTNVELSVLTGEDSGTIDAYIEDGINYLRKAYVKSLLEDKDIKCCAKCGETENIEKKGGFYICTGECINKSRPMERVEREFDAPVSIVVQIALNVYRRMSIVTKVTGLQKHDIENIVKRVGKELSDFVPMKASNSRKLRFSRRTHHYPKTFDRWKESYGITVHKSHKPFLDELERLIRR